MFEINSSKHRCETSQQTVDAVVVAEGAVVFSGTLRPSGNAIGCKSVHYNYTATFALTSQSEGHIVLDVQTAKTFTGTSAAGALGRADADADADADAEAGSKLTTGTVSLLLQTASSEKIYGLGVQYSVRNLKGRVVPVLTSEQGIGRGLEPLTALLNAAAKSGGSWHTTYSAIPHYVTSQLKSFFLEGSNYATFDMTANHEIKIQVFAPGFRSRAILGYSPLQHIEEYTIYAGRMKPIPSWLLSGPVIGYEGGTQKVLDLYAKLTNNNIKPTAFWLQDWSGLRIDTFGKREC